MDNLLSQKIMDMRQSFFDEGVLDASILIELERFETNADDPNFVEDVLLLYIKDSTTHVALIEETLHRTQVDYARIAHLLYRIHSGACSVGAIKIRDVVIQTKEYCRQNILASTLESFQKLKAEQATFSAKLKPYLELLREAKFAIVDMPYRPRPPN